MKVNLYGIFSSKNGSPPKAGGPVQPNTSNMPKAGRVENFGVYLCMCLCLTCTVCDVIMHPQISSGRLSVPDETKADCYR